MSTATFFTQGFALASVFLLVPEVQGQTTWYVRGSNACPGMGTQEDPFCGIQDGITAATNGDTVLVADGIYTGAGNRDLDFGGRLITLQSETGPDTCIIDCQGVGRGFVFQAGENGDAVVDGFTVRNGSVMRDGGAIYMRGSSPTIRGCVLAGNIAGYRGGAVSCNDGSSPLFLDSYIMENIAEFRGGGINCDHDSSPTFVNSVIRGNTVEYRGGGLYCDHNSNPTLINCLVNGNYAEARGSGISCDHASHALVINSTISGNLGGGDGIYVDHESVPTIRNSILWGNTFFQLGGLPEYATVTFSNLQGGWPGVGNIDGDPLFVDAANADYRLSPGSPCIDAADNTAVPEGILIDIGGDPRFVDDVHTDDTGLGDPPLVDMGAYELQYQLYCADDDGDGRVTMCHVPPGNPDNAHTITVSVKASAAHLAHGDHCGPCTEMRTTRRIGREPGRRDRKKP